MLRFRKVFLNFTLILFFLFCYLDVFSRCGILRSCGFSLVETKDIHQNNFFQTNKIINFALDTEDDFSSDLFPRLGINDGKVPASPIIFDPPYMDFYERPIGQPHLEQVTIINIDTRRSLHLLSISASTTHFHCSFFQDKVVSPKGNTTFDVVFLAREVGNVENTLFIKTSSGTFKYQVFGIGVPSPYRVHPFVGARIPVNTSFSPYLHLYNPHSFPLQVLEMYTSGGDLHLELPKLSGVDSSTNSQQHQWLIPPYETRTVMRLRMIGREESNQTGYVKVKTNETVPGKFGLVLPVEVEVSSKPGLYATIDKLDFGILRTLDNAKSLTLLVTNLESSPLHVTQVELDTPNDAVRIDFRPMKILPGTERQTPVAVVTFTAFKALHPRQHAGYVIVRSKDGKQELRIPYRVSILHGSLVYDPSSTKFYTKQTDNITRAILISNTFNHSVVIYNVTLSDAQPYFTLINFTDPVIIESQQTKSPFCVLVNMTAAHNVQHISQIAIFSNASLFVIPLFLYNGDLRVVPHRPDATQNTLDFGTMGVEETRSMTFTLRNENPVEVNVHAIRSFSADTRLELLGVERGNGTLLTRAHNVSALRSKSSITLKPFHFAVYSMHVVAPPREGMFMEDIEIETNFGRKSVSYIIRAAEGSLSAIPEKIVLEMSHPGRVSCRWLTLQSRFNDYVELQEMNFHPPDARFYFMSSQSDKQSALPVVLKPFGTSTVGKICFDHRRVCGFDCYAGFSTSTSTGQEWLLGFNLDNKVADVDQYYYNRLTSHWDNLVQSERNIVNATVMMSTSQIKGFLFHAQANLVWPSLQLGVIERGVSEVRFALTQIGNASWTELVLENPSDLPILVQLIPLHLYPQPETALELLNLNRLDYVETEDSVMKLETIGASPPYPGESNTVAQVHRQQFAEFFTVTPHPDTIVTLIKPLKKARFRLGFYPVDSSLRSGVFLIRNNLTGLEAVIAKGVGSHGQLTLQDQNADTGVIEPLMFELTEKQLKNCGKLSHLKSGASSGVLHTPVRRSVSFKNSGELPLIIERFSMHRNQSTCRSRGFQILQCGFMEVNPNVSRSVEISFSPDFTEYRIAQTLYIFTSLRREPYEVPLRALLPGHMLSICARSLPRPDWEYYVYSIVIGIMLTISLTVLVTAYFEADKVCSMDFFYRMGGPAAAGKIFNLTALAQEKSQLLQQTSSTVDNESVTLIESSSVSHLHKNTNNQKISTPSNSLAKSKSNRSFVRSNSTEPSTVIPTISLSSNSSNNRKTLTQQQQQNSCSNSGMFGRLFTSWFRRRDSEVSNISNSSSLSGKADHLVTNDSIICNGTSTQTPTNLSVNINNNNNQKYANNNTSSAAGVRRRKQKNLQSNNNSSNSPNADGELMKTLPPTLQFEPIDIPGIKKGKNRPGRKQRLDEDKSKSLSGKLNENCEDTQSNATDSSDEKSDIIATTRKGIRSDSIIAEEKLKAQQNSEDADVDEDVEDNKKQKKKYHKNSSSKSSNSSQSTASSNQPIARAVPLQPQPVRKQPKTSIVKPMTQFRPKDDSDIDSDYEEWYDDGDESEKENIEWDVSVADMEPEEFDSLAHRTANFDRRVELQQKTPGYQALKPQQHHQQNVLSGYPNASGYHTPQVASVAPFVEDVWGSKPAPQPLPSELSAVTWRKTQSMFNYEEYRRQQAQQTWSVGSFDFGGMAMPNPWNESTMSNKNLWGGAPTSDTTNLEDSSNSVGTSNDSFARMLVGESLLWDSSASSMVGSGWACYPNESDDRQED